MSLYRRNLWIALLVLAVLVLSCSRPASSPPASPPQTPILILTQAIPPGLEIPDLVTPSPTSVSTLLGATGIATDTAVTAEINPTTPVTTPDLPVEYPIIQLPLEGPINTSQAEISGMDWYQDRLVLLPQYPDRFGEGEDGAVFILDKAEIQAFLDGESNEQLQPRPIPFIASGLEENIPGFEGYEAIAFSGDRVYLTIEASQDQMLSYLVTGFVGGDLEWLSIDTSSLLPIQAQTGVPNFSYESIVIFGNRLVTIYEANGTAVNPSPVATMFDTSPQLQDQLSFPNIEYRLTDATGVDDFGRFWMPNTFFTGDILLMSINDPIAEEFGRGATHSQSLIVERLLEFQFSEQGIVRTETPPIQLQLVDDIQTRNWEAIARLDEQGFLIATDEHPQTILAFVALGSQP